jgi:hypothetical protein
MRDRFYNLKSPILFLLVASVALLAGCSDNTAGTGTAATPTASTVAGIQISGTPSTIKSDNSTNTTITVTAVDANNATVPLTKITLNADTGLLASSTLTTDATGKASTTFSSGSANKANRTATITATAGSANALLPVQIVGSTLTLNSTGTSVPSNGTSPVTLTIAAQDAGGFPISGADITLSYTGGGAVTFTPATGKTGSDGKLAISVVGAAAGAVVVNAAGAGTQATTNFTVSSTASTFGINLLSLNASPGVVPVSPKNTAMKIGDALAVQVNAPSPTTDVTFATTIGSWNGTGNKVVTVPVSAGVATASLSATVAGVAGVQVLDTNNSTLSDTLSVGITAKTPASISLQATPTVIPQSVGTTLGYSNLTAVVYDASGAPVGGAPVSFSIVSGTGTGAGETVAPVVA